MTNIVTIRKNAEKAVNAVLGSSAKELPIRDEIDKNNDKDLQYGYMVCWGDGEEDYRIDQVVNMQQSLNVDISRKCYLRANDEKAQDEIDYIYEKCDEIVKKFRCGKLGLNGIIQKVQLTSLSEPRRIGEGRDIVTIRMVFRMSYIL